MPGTPKDQKRALRAEIRERRRIMTAAARTAAAGALQTRLEGLCADLGARSLACYLSATTEPNTRPFLNAIFARGTRILLPVTRDDGLLDWVAADGHSEIEGRFGIPEAVGEVQPPIAINEMDLILIPALAVDRQGNRLGQGRGYYDKTLGSMDRCPPVYAVVFDSEVFDRIPIEGNDRRVDGAVCPHATLTFRTH